MDKINFFPDNLDVQNKKIILRLDLNVPLKDRVIEDFHLLENSSGINFDGVTYDVDRFYLQLEESEDLLVTNDVCLY